MQRELVRRRGIADLLEKPELLEKIEPNRELVRTLLTHRELLKTGPAYLPARSSRRWWRS